ncbi:phytanoyl-CoA dioxygenase family protein [Porphyrobacter sp. YT40]|uniref:phytanoyl-CoA dioxygenase family protein n=1 Tax=Porphyrobacter sp. YT40 TaxID=2547601 RepID=UPI0015E898BA|nr:phytanoyl-CoA dioxygenase family protein [Porphyrobacter sp. YT40]
MGTVELAMLTEQALDQAAEELWREGVCTLRQAVDPGVLADCLAQLQAHHPRLFKPDATADKLFVSTGRFYTAVEIGDALARRDVLLPAAVEGVLTAALGPDFVFDSWGVINALPGAEEQHWHRDGGILFPGHPLENMLPATAVTLAIPLVEMNDETGTTGFARRTHRAGDHPEVPDYEPRVPVGDALLWDYRVFHKGMTNRSAIARPLIYATLCRDWWSDTQNHEGQARLLFRRTAWETLDPALQPRFARAQLID